MLGIIGLVIGGIWWSAAIVAENNRINDFASSMALIATNVEADFQKNRQPLPANGMMEYLRAKGLIRNQAFVTQSGWGNTPWLAEERLGRNAFITWGWDISPSNTAPLYLMALNVDKSACAKLMAHIRPYLRESRYPSRMAGAVRSVSWIESHILSNCQSSGILEVQFMTIFPVY